MASFIFGTFSTGVNRILSNFPVFVEGFLAQCQSKTLINSSIEIFTNTFNRYVNSKLLDLGRVSPIQVTFEFDVVENLYFSRQDCSRSWIIVRIYSLL